MVPSAPGKRFKEDTKVTDLLYRAYNAKTENEFHSTFEEIKSRYQDIIDGLQLDISNSSTGNTIIQMILKKN